MTSPHDGRRVRLADVALAAGVSKSIASRILNDDASLNVRPETRERVKATAAKMNYKAHRQGIWLRTAKVGVLGFLTPDIRNPVLARIIRGAAAEAEAHDVSLLLQEDFDTSESSDRAEELFQSGRIDGFLVASARDGHPLIEHLKGTAIPHVFVNRAVPGSGRNVTMNDALASAMAVHHLVDLGHTSIAHLGGPLTLDTAQRRAAGFRSAARSRRVKAKVVTATFDGMEAAEDAVLSLVPRATGIFVSSIDQSVGLLRRAHELGVRVPRDLSVVTFDDAPLARLTVPSLTSIQMPFEELGALAVRELMAQLQGATPRDVEVETAPTLVVRESTDRGGR